MAEPMSGEIPSEFRPFAALLTSKTYFYIGVLNEAVEFALKAGKAFENEPAGEYKETIIGESAGETRGVSVGFLPQLVR
jgi:26S proteasome regulatory subunit N2